MKHLSLLLLLSVFLASCGQEVAPPSLSPVSPVKSEVSVPIVEKEFTPIVESNSWVAEQSLTWAVSSSWSTKEASFSDAQIQDILAKIESYMNSLNARANTGSLVVGDYSAQYNQSQSWDTIDVNINGVKSTIEGIRTKEDVMWLNQCDELAKKLDCYNITTWKQSKEVKSCENLKVEWKKCLEDLMDNWFSVAWQPDFYHQLLDFSPSGKYILVDAGIRGHNVSAPQGSFLIDTKTGAKILRFMTKNDSYQAVFEWWTPDKSQFIYISKVSDINSGYYYWLLNVTKKDKFPESSAIQLDTGVSGGWNDDQYVYLLSEKDSIKKLTIFSITDLKEVFSKEIK